MLPLKFIQRRIEGGFSEVESVSATAATGRYHQFALYGSRRRPARPHDVVPPSRQARRRQAGRSLVRPAHEWRVVAGAVIELPPSTGRTQSAAAGTALAGTSDSARGQKHIMSTTTPNPPSGYDRPHEDSWLESIGKAIIAPVQGAQGRSAVAYPEPDRSPPAPPARPDVHHELPDQRDPRTVGDNNDGILKALGKAIVAPIDGAHEAAVRPDARRACSGPAGAQTSNTAGTAPASPATRFTSSRSA